MPRIKTLKTCAFCSKQVYRIAGHDLCANCYYREKRNGTPAYTKVRKTCKIEGCDDLSHSQGLCNKHLSRLKKHGIAEHERFDRWGHASKHPLAHVYYHMRRTYAREVDPEWISNFWKFVEDVGERPGDNHRFRRINKSLPFQKSNVRWEAPMLDVPLRSREDAAGYARAHRAARPDWYRDQHLRKTYGKSLAWFDATFAEQNGGCAICGGTEIALDWASGLPRQLSVDHCHANGHVRGLLCKACNTALGAFRDDPTILRTAIAYLEKHALPPPEK